MDKKQELINLVKNSNLSEEDKQEWEEMVSSSPEDLIGGLWETLRRFPDELSWFNVIYKRKKNAFEELKMNKIRGQELLQEIYKEEKNKLEELSK